MPGIHKSSAQYEEAQERPCASLSDREQALIALLAQGYTDSSAARMLQISPRSITYTLRALMDRFGVDSRFQLGLALGASDIRPGRTNRPRPDACVPAPRREGAHG